MSRNGCSGGQHGYSWCRQWVGTGWVLGGAIPGQGEYYPAAKQGRRPATAGSGPCRGQGGSEAGPAPPRSNGGGGDGPRYHPCGARSVPASRAFPVPGTSQIAASWPITATFHPYFSKVSQNHGVSPKYPEKACHSPCIQNGPRKSPLEILRFSYSSAFSHKELMGHFDG